MNIHGSTGYIRTCAVLQDNEVTWTGLHKELSTCIVYAGAAVLALACRFCLKASPGSFAAAAFSLMTCCAATWPYKVDSAFTKKIGI